MSESGQERLELSYTSKRDGNAVNVRQTVRLAFTRPQYGGKRWWMLCPVTGRCAAKLYLPPGGDVFACRGAWRLNYQSQRDAKRDRPFERLFRLQKKLGCPQGYEMPIRRPKGMWRRTWERHLDEYEKFDGECEQAFAVMVARMMELSRTNHQKSD